MRIFVCIFLLAAVLYGIGFAQCTKDLDCKGDRVCVNGECREPETPKQAQPASVAHEGTESPAPRPGENVESSQGTGWGNAAGITGLALSPIILGLSIGSTIARASSDDIVPALPLGVSSQVVADIAVPIVAVGGSSSRHAGGRGIPGLRIPGWITFGLSNAFLAIIAGVAIGGGGGPPPAVLISEGVLSTASCIMLSADALASKSQAKTGRRAECWSTPKWYLSLGVMRNGGVNGGVMYCF